MPRTELREIVLRGTQRLTLSVDTGALDRITGLSQGLPYYTHLLGLYASRQAIDRQSKVITYSDVLDSIRIALDRSQQSIKNAYYEATKSPRPENLFRQVLLACALAETDEFGYFTAAAVRDPISMIMNDSYDITRFAGHLNSFSSDRGPVLQKTGVERKYRYRFLNPLLQPYVIMIGLRDKLISDTQLGE
jgi:hypothetical protein